MQMDTVALTALVLVTSGLVEVLKQALDVPTKFLPLTAVLVGVLSSLAYALGFQGDLLIHALYGVVIGLSSAGLYDNIEQVIK